VHKQNTYFSKLRQYHRNSCAARGQTKYTKKNYASQ
jgi:hypothetical protein